MQTTPLPPPDAFILYHVPVRNRRPASVLVLGILGIVLSSYALLSATAALLILVAFPRSLIGMRVISDVPPERVWQAADQLGTWGFYSVLLWWSIAAIKLRPWARRRLLRWAWLYLAWLAFLVLAELLWVIPAWTTFYARQGQAPTPSDRWTRHVILAASIGVSVIYPIILIAVMRRRHVRAAFEDEAAAAAGVPVASLAPVPAENAGGAEGASA